MNTVSIEFKGAPGSGKTILSKFLQTVFNSSKIKCTKLKGHEDTLTIELTEDDKWKLR